MNETFFDPDAGVSDPLWMQHVLWFLGHPEVLLPIILLVASGLIYVSFKIAKDLVSRLYVGAGIFVLACGIVLSIEMLNASTSRSLHDTYYVVAHIEFTLALLGILVLFLIGYGLLRKWYSRRLGVIQFGLAALGTTLVVLPQVSVGLNGMPQRYTDYDQAMSVWNQIAGLGVLSLLASFGLFAIVVGHALWTRAKNKPDETHD